MIVDCNKTFIQDGGQEHKTSTRSASCGEPSDIIPSYPCSMYPRRFLLLESNEIELEHPQDEA